MGGMNSMLWCVRERADDRANRDYFWLESHQRHNITLPWGIRMAGLGVVGFKSMLSHMLAVGM